MALVMAVPQQARADRWYHSGWFIGGAGLVAGTVIGYGLANSGRSERYDRVYYYHYEPRPVRVVQSDVYVEETRLWPFYRRTRVYPVLSRTQWQDEAVSMAPIVAARESARREAAERRPASEGITINIGDNNSDVRVTVNPTTGDSGAPTRSTSVIKQIPNDAAGRTGRMVDVPVSQPESAATPTPAPTTSAER
jgi:hypothetical protein